MPKLECLSCMPNNQFHVKKWSFDPKFSNLVHECTIWILHVESWRNMFQSKIKSFSWVLNYEYNASHGGVCRCHGLFDEEESEFDEMSFELSWKMVKWMRNEALEPRKMFPLENLVFVVSHLSSSLTLQRQMAQMRLKGSKYGVYIHALRWRVGQKSLKYWLETLYFNIGPFTLTPINDQIRYPHWKANNFRLPHWIELKYWTYFINTPMEGIPLVSCQSRRFRVGNSKVKDKG